MFPKSFFQMLFARLGSAELALAAEALTEATPPPQPVDEKGCMCVVTETYGAREVGPKVRAIKAFRRILHLGLREGKDLVEGILEGKPYEVRLLPGDVQELCEAGLRVEEKPKSATGQVEVREEEKSKDPMYRVTGSFIGAEKDVHELHRLIVVRTLSRALKKTRPEVEDLISTKLVNGLSGILVPNLSKDDQNDLEMTGLQVLYSAATPTNATGHQVHISGSFREDFWMEMEEKAVQIFCTALRISESEAQALLGSISRKGVLVSDLSQEDQHALSMTGLLVVPQGIFVGPPSPFPWPR